MVVNASLVLQFISSLGVQINSKYGDPINGVLLSVALYAAAFAVFPLTLLSLIAALRQRVTPEQLRKYLLDDDDDEGGNPVPNDAPLPLLARFGEFSINAQDVSRALHAPLLTEVEVKTLRSASLLQDFDPIDTHEASAGREADATVVAPRGAATATARDTVATDRMRGWAPAAPMSDKYTADAADLMLDAPAEAAKGVASQLGVPYLELLGRMSRGIAAIEDECEAHGTDEDRRWLRYVLHQAVDEQEAAHEPCRAGQTIDYFVRHPKAVAAGLEEAHVVALRFYTSQAFTSLNEPLRQPSGEHPFAVTVAFLSEGIKRLRAVEASERTSLRLWRGLRNVRGDIPRTGGTERAPLSCTSDLSTAARFAASRDTLLFLVTPKSFMQRGAELAFLSCMPHEREVCYPPFTFLKPTGRTQRLDLAGRQASCVIVEVTPHVGS